MKRPNGGVDRATALPSSLAGLRLMRKALPVAPVQRFVGLRPKETRRPPRTEVSQSERSGGRVQRKAEQKNADFKTNSYYTNKKEDEQRKAKQHQRKPNPAARAETLPQVGATHRLNWGQACDSAILNRQGFRESRFGESQNRRPDPRIQGS